MDLLSLLNVGIVLSDSLESELVHQVDGVGVVAVAILPGGEEEREYVRRPQPHRE